MTTPRKAYPAVALLALATLLAFSPDSQARRRKGSEKVIDRVAAAFIPAPRDGEVCFSPEEHCDLKLIKFIETAQTSIDVAIYDVNLDQLVTRLLNASRKLRVRFVVDTRQARSDHSLVPLLLKAGAQVKLGHQRGIMHNKFVVVDGHRLATGSFNFTNGAAFKNNENQLYLGDPAIVARYAQRFETLWREGTPADELAR